jgi:hypothetical protein
MPIVYVQLADSKWRQKDMKLFKMVLIIALNVMLFPTIVLAKTGSRSTQSSGGAVLTLIILWICVRRKKKEIGGWLLLFYIQLYLGIFITIITSISSYTAFMPSSWAYFKVYALFLFSSLPSIIIRLSQAVVGTEALRERSYEMIQRLRILLVIDIVFGILSILIDSHFFPHNMIADFVQLIWPVIWLPYFYKSIRVQKVFDTKDWLTYAEAPIR